MDEYGRADRLPGWVAGIRKREVRRQMTFVGNHSAGGLGLGPYSIGAVLLRSRDKQEENALKLNLSAVD